MEPEITPPIVEAIRRWCGVEPPNAAALHGLANMAHLIADIERVRRGGFVFEDEPSGFEAALRDLNPPSATEPLADLSMAEMAVAFRRGEVRAEALVRACLGRAARHDGQVNAVVRLDRDAALEAASAADKRRAACGADPGPQAGVPMMHKDMHRREGRVSTCGSRIRRDFTPRVTATVLRRLDAAGAIDMGTLGMAELA